MSIIAFVNFLFDLFKVVGLPENLWQRLLDRAQEINPAIDVDALFRAFEALTAAQLEATMWSPHHENYTYIDNLTELLALGREEFEGGASIQIFLPMEFGGGYLASYPGCFNADGNACDFWDTLSWKGQGWDCHPAN